MVAKYKFIQYLETQKLEDAEQWLNVCKYFWNKTKEVKSYMNYYQLQLLFAKSKGLSSEELFKY